MITVDGLYKRFDGVPVLDGVSFSVERGRVLALIGPSGGGKSTLLRCLNLLTPPDRGVIDIGGLRVDCGAHPSPATRHRLRRATAMVFQHYNLFRNKTALDNITLPLVSARGMRHADAVARARDLLAAVGLADKAGAYPATLSGGQQQRVGIARALALDPEVILFDEPTSALDPERVAEVLDVIRELVHRDITMIIATHEIDFARQVADQVLFMADGRVVERGPARQVLDQSGHERTRRFLGLPLAPAVAVPA